MKGIPRLAYKMEAYFTYYDILGTTLGINRMYCEVVNACGWWQKILYLHMCFKVANAFGNYRNILKEVAYNRKCDSAFGPLLLFVRPARTVGR